MKKLFIPVALVFFFLSAYGQSNKIKIEEFTLPNGLQVVLNPDKTSPIVVVDICYHVGSKNESEKRRGFAHLFEHLMFDGSTNVARGEFDKHIYSAGGDDNAFTNEDITNYYDLLPVNQLELALWLESDRMMQFGVKDIGLKVQKGVVKEERKQSYENQPYGSVQINLAEMSYKVHPYKSPVIGYAENIDAATLNDVKDFFENFYVPNNATLVIVGDIDIARTKDLIVKYFSDIPKEKKEIIRTFGVEPKKTQQESKVVYDNIMFDGLFLAYPIPEIGHEDSYALDLLSSILSSGKSSRLYERMVYHEQSAMDASCYTDLREHPGLFVFSIISSGKAQAPDLEKEIYEEIEKIKTEGVSENELEKVKNKYEADFISHLEMPFQRAVLLATAKTIQNDANLINTETEKYLKVTTQDIQRVAKKYLNKESSTLLYYKPETKK
jgi:zinc protease